MAERFATYYPLAIILALLGIAVAASIVANRRERATPPEETAGELKETGSVER